LVYRENGQTDEHRPTEEQMETNTIGLLRAYDLSLQDNMSFELVTKEPSDVAYTL